MPAAVPIVINDGAATPVAHTFTPVGKDEKGVLWFEQTTPAPATPLEAKRIGYKQIRGTSSAQRVNGVSKVVYSLALPKLETLGNNSAGIVPPPTLAYRTVARLEFDLPERSAAQERKDTRVLLTNLMANALVIANLEALQVTY
jgi:hypothetical protein